MVCLPIGSAVDKDWLAWERPLLAAGFHSKDGFLSLLFPQVSTFLLYFWATKLSSSAKSLSTEDMPEELSVLNYCHFGCWRTSLWSQFVLPLSVWWDAGPDPLSLPPYATQVCSLHLVPLSAPVFPKVVHGYTRYFVKNWFVLSEFGK